MSKILVIEDNIDVLENLVTLLTEEGYSVSFTTDGETGLKKITSEKPHLVICDILLPKTDGYNLRKELKEKGIDNIPFIYLTALSDYENYRKGMKLGADDFILKPYKTDDLLNSISLRLRKYYGKTSSKIIINKGNKEIPVEKNSIIAIQSENQYSKIITTGKETFVVRKSLNDWMNTLPGDTFTRISRFAIINKTYVTSITKENGKKLVILKNCKLRLIVSRNYYSKLKEELGTSNPETSGNI